MSIVLKHTTRQNIGTNMYPDQHDGEPFLEIIENAKSRGFRFRYTCEGPSHGGIPGCSSDRNKKTFPAVRICNYQGYARIVVQLVTNEENPRLHPHSLVGKQCQNGICTVQCGPRDMTATFPNLGIQHVTKKNVANILEERYIAAEMQLSSINDGFPQDVQKNIKVEDRRRIAAKAQAEAKSIDLAVVRLMFIAYLPDSNGAFTIMLKPVISLPIYDSKAPNAATLKICRMDCNAGSACGGDEVYLLCDKVQKDDIQVRFFEENMRGDVMWEGLGSFAPTDVHRQFAIVFKTPPYRDQNISTHVNVQVQLRRKSDQEVSEARPFTYLPNQSDFEGVEKKKRKILRMTDVMGSKNVINLTSSHQLFAITHNSTGSSTGGGRSSSGGGGDGSYSNTTSNTMTSSPPADVIVKQETPQYFPLDPRALFKPSNDVMKTETKENSQEQQTVERRFIEGTQIPLPQSCQLHSEIVQQKKTEELLSVFDEDSDALSPSTSATLSTDDVITSSPLHDDKQVMEDCSGGGLMSTISPHDMNDIFPSLNLPTTSFGFNFADSNNILSPNCEFNFFSNIAMDTGNVAMATSDKDGYMTALRYTEEDAMSKVLEKLSITKHNRIVKDAATEVDGMTVLINAMKCMDVSLMSALMDLCANYDVNDGMAWNILHQAVKTNNVAAVEILMKKLRNSFELYIDGDGNTCGHLACESDNDVMLASLLRHHRRHRSDDDVTNGRQNYKGETLYHVCARRNSTKCLDELFKCTDYSGGDVDALNHDGLSALSVALDNGNYDLAIELIVQHGARLDDVSDDDVTRSPVYRIVTGDRLQFAPLLASYTSAAWWRSLPMSAEMAELVETTEQRSDDDDVIKHPEQGLGESSKLRTQVEEILSENFDSVALKELEASLGLPRHNGDDVSVTSLLDRFVTRGGKIAELLTEMTNLDCDVMTRWLLSANPHHQLQRDVIVTSPQVCVSA